MSAFDLIIGYEPIKKELLQICDMIRNPGVYHEMGAVLPRGMLLYGDPGLGKTLAAKAFILESGLKVFTIRKNTGKDNLIDQITDTFKKAAEEAPCIVFLDDLDKFANEDKSHRDAEEYAAVQAGIDDVKGRDRLHDCVRVPEKPLFLNVDKFFQPQHQRGPHLHNQ